MANEKIAAYFDRQAADLETYELKQVSGRVQRIKKTAAAAAKHFEESFEMICRAGGMGLAVRQGEVELLVVGVEGAPGGQFYFQGKEIKEGADGVTEKQVQTVNLLLQQSILPL